nr:condensation domain-containing protein [Amycolatopsis umgeniensis]
MTSAPLTYEQDWLDAKLRGGRVYRNVQLSYEIIGDLDPAALTAAVRDCVRRHDALRMRIDGTGQHPVELAADEEPVRCLEVTAASSAQFGRYASALLSRDLLRPWDNALPCSFILLRRDDHHHAFLATFHRLFFDARARELFGRDLWACYAARTRGRPSLPAAPSFAEAATRQRTRATARTLARAKESWRDRLEFCAENPWVRPPSATETESGVITLELDGRVTGSLRAATGRTGHTPLQWVVAAFARAATECAGLPRAGMWTSMDTRLSADREVVGMFAAACPIALRRPGADDAALLAEVRGQLLNALRYHQVTADDLDDLVPGFGSGSVTAPGMDIYVNLLDATGGPDRPPSTGGLRVTADAYPLLQDSHRSSWALHLRCAEHRDRIALDLVYDGERVGEPLARSIMDHVRKAAGPS